MATTKNYISTSVLFLSFIAAGAGYFNVLILIPYLGDTLGLNNYNYHILIAAQFALGFMLASIQPRAWLLLSGMTITIPLGISVFGIMTEIEKHNLWPLELFFELLFVGAAIAGAAAAWGIHRYRNQEKIELNR